MAEAPGFLDGNWAAVRSIMRVHAEAKKLAFLTNKKLDMNPASGQKWFRSEAGSKAVGLRPKPPSG
jgi:hypothetical protein